MKKVLDSAKDLVLKCAKVCYERPADFWQSAAMLTISVYHLCQVAIIGINKDTPKREKAFLIPQEIMDGVINLATFVAFAQGFKQAGRLAVKKGIVAPFKPNDRFSEEFATATNLAGSLLAVNIVSPVIRNKFGAVVQKRFEQGQIVPAKENKSSQMSIYNYNNSSAKTTSVGLRI